MRQKARNSYEVLPAIEEVLHESTSEQAPFFVLGGIMTAALRDERTIIDFDEKRVIAPKDVAISTRRKNGTKRDIDILIAKDISHSVGRKVARDVSEAIDSELDVSVFGLESRDDVQGKSRLVRHATEWLSRRTVDEDGVHRYELYPLEQTIRADSYDTWTLTYNSDSKGVSVLHPVGHALAYRMRSISGIRSKDKEKLAEMEQRVYSHSEALEAHHGMFYEWALFAGRLACLRANNCFDTTEYRECTDVDTKNSDIVIAQAKAGLLGYAETIEPIGDIAQQSKIQSLLKPLIRQY